MVINIVVLFMVIIAATLGLAYMTDAIPKTSDAVNDTVAAALTNWGTVTTILWAVAIIGSVGLIILVIMGFVGRRA